MCVTQGYVALQGGGGGVGRCHAHQTRFSQARANQTRPPRRGFSATRPSIIPSYLYVKIPIIIVLLLFGH